MAETSVLGGMRAVGSFSAAEVQLKSSYLVECERQCGLRVVRVTRAGRTEAERFNKPECLPLTDIFRHRVHYMQDGGRIGRGVVDLHGPLVLVWQRLRVLGTSMRM